MKIKIYFRIIGLSVLFVLQSCEDFVDIDSPNFQMVTEDVYNKEKTTIAAIQGIYNQLYVANFSTYGVSVLGAMSADILLARTDTYLPFDQHELFSINTTDAGFNQNIWSSAYNMIYMVNRALEGLENANISDDLRQNLQGQILFTRAFTYFYLTNLYGDVPLLLTSDYDTNAIAPRNSKEEVWLQIESDLDEAAALLNKQTEYKDGERFYVNLSVVEAFRARVYLYRKDWSNAESFSSNVIARADLYGLEANPEDVFRANSKEAIWQITPDGVRNFAPEEATHFTLHVNGTGTTITGNTALSDDFLNSLVPLDKRRLWIGEVSSENEHSYFSKKYWFDNDGEIQQYSTVLRLAEQYLIRAEARAMQNKLAEAISDLDQIRARAGIDLITDSNPGINKQALLDTIMIARKRELFAEWGHRWFDLKRTGKVNTVFSSNPTWQNSDALYPIPGEERLKNPFLTQNDGYGN
ncbi:RagB/SusD family nutrient uptake outer membrane protein [Galbibacter orientalis]|uniref:RagB/SusD family nutrient uptake outer membrane protein n=1 Tax=Galbibacter orientalis TaxID=453852 RepID=UPI003080535D